jgi:hypothetical protein
VVVVVVEIDIRILYQCLHHAQVDLVDLVVVEMVLYLVMVQQEVASAVAVAVAAEMVTMEIVQTQVLVVRASVE